MTDRDQQLADLLDQLNPSFEAEPEWEDAIARAHAEPPCRTTRRRRKAPILAAGAALAVTIALLILSPWRSSPTIVDLASAALTPKPGQITYESIEGTQTYLRTGVVSRATRKFWLGLDGQFRSLELVSGRPALEEGRLRTGLPLLTYMTVTNTMTATCGSPLAPRDPVQVVRRDLSKGTLRARGTTNVDHRPAEVLEYTSPGDTEYLYVDPSTYYPIELQSDLSSPSGRLVLVVKFLAFRYLPATPANLKLTNIQAEHPSARLTSTTSYRTPC